MKIEDTRSMTPDQLKDELLTLKKEAFNLRFQQAIGQLENTARMREVRRDIARIKMVLGDQQRAEAGGRGDDVAHAHPVHPLDDDPGHHRRPADEDG